MAPQEPAKKPVHLTPSPLGTKAYWDTLYSTEITNHAHDPADIGTIWFSDSFAEEKVLAFLCSRDLGLDRERCTFIDLGTGNGSFLFRLRGGVERDDDSEDEDEDEEAPAAGFRGRMLGVDYSDKGIELANAVAEEKGFGAGAAEQVEFRHWSIMSDEPGLVLDGAQSEGWDVVLDKGTFDAICLSEERDAGGRRICEGYKARVEALVKNGGRFLVTSCNWTGEELKGWFEGGSWVVEGEVRYGSFMFGGKRGQTVSSVCFRKGGG